LSYKNINDLVEKLAELEHDQWIHYSKDVADRIKNACSLEQLLKETIQKWQDKWIDYCLLSEEDKNKDKVWAIKVLELLKENKQLLNNL
jgi:hypothetical protein